MDSAKRFRLTAKNNRSAIVSGIEEFFQLSSYKNDVRRSSLYDTFDWSLYKGNRWLISSGNSSMRLMRLSSGKVLNEEKINIKTLPRFWWDFSDSDLKLALRDIIDVRALLKIKDFEETRDIYNALNEDAKTVARIGFYKITVLDTLGVKREMQFLELMPLRGYDNELKVIHKKIMQLKIQPVHEDSLLALLRETGIMPGKYTSKINILLEPDEPCDRAMRRILKQMLNVIKQNEDGIKKDIDTEFLHDFRVAIRRTRSAISQIPDIFPEEKNTRFKEDFKFLGQLSNRLRDLDVYLLNKDYFAGLLPEELRSGLSPFFKSLRQERQRRFKKFIGEINGNRYEKILTEWEQLLDREYSSDDAMTNSVRPVLPVAKEFIFRRFKKIIKSGRRLDETYTDESMHGLRIHCKKLRYLLEFFASLFSQTDIDLFIKQLKKMQDSLGDFNDLRVQQEELRGHLNRINVNTKRTVKDAAALGGLISVLKNKQDDIRSQFKIIFEEFHNRKNTALFHKLFD
jgi:CHAD domain-containing protein